MATVFVGGSALLLAGAMAALAFGFANGEDALVWTALIASGAAAVFLVIAYGISRRELKRANSRVDADPDHATEAPVTTDESRSETTEPAREDEATATVPAASASDKGDSTADDATSEEEPERDTSETGGDGDSAAVPSSAAMSAGSPTTKPSGTGKKASAPSTAAAAKPSSPTDTVVGIATKKKFHRTDCRYAASDSAEEMTRAAARKRGFTPCGICKP